MSDLTTPSLFFSQASKYGKRTALKVKRKGRYRDISWEEFARHVKIFALKILSHHIDAGDRLAILSENRPEWAYADLAIQSCNAITVPIYATSTAKEIEQILLDCKAKIIFVSNDEQSLKVNSIKQNLPFLEKLIVFDDFDYKTSDEQTEAFVPLLEERLKNMREDDIATIIYTSGTTGEPKGVMLTHKNFLSNCHSCADVLPINNTDIYLSFLPLSHVFERMAGFYLMMSLGVSIAYAESLDLVAQNILEIRPTIMCGVPRFYEKMFIKVNERIPRNPILKRILLPFIKRVVRKKLGGRLRFFVSGGAPLSREIAEFFLSFGVLILEGYGLTETSPVITVNRPRMFKFGTVGIPIPDVEIKLAEDGEILTKGPNVMKGYYNRQDQTNEVIKDDWFYTGDIGNVDEDGFLMITDRKKELIVTSGGKNVAPQKIENLLVADRFISQAFVYGDRHNYLVALLVPRFDALRRYAEYKKLPERSNSDLLKNPQIMDLIRRRIDRRSIELARYEQIKYFALMEREFSQEKGELTPTLKIKRRVVSERYKDLLESLYSEESTTR